MRSILVPAAVLDSVSKRLERLSAKAGVSVQRVAGETKIYRLVRRNDAGERIQFLRVDRSRVIACARLTIGDMPRCNGFEFIGKLEHTEAGNMLKMAPGRDSSEISAEWRDAKPTCDHCNTVRSRTETFLIRDPQGAIVRVGRNCLQDFTGSAEAMIALEQFQDVIREISDSEYERGGSGGWSWGIDTMHYLACCVRASVNGYVKRDDPQGRESTRDTAAFAAGDCPAHPKAAEAWRALQPIADDQAQAVAIVVWLSEQDSSKDYIHNLQVAVQLSEASDRNMGLLASAPAAYTRAMGDIAARKARGEAKYFGTVKGRTSVPVTVTYVTSYDTVYGTKYVIGMRTDCGCDLVCKTTSAEHPRTSDVGSRFELRATVKAHGEYKGRKQTEVQRAIWTAIGDEQAAEMAVER